jgi:type IV secretory pathway TrbD component
MAILRALVRPELWLGCDRTLLILLGTVCFVLIGPAGIGAGHYGVAALGGVVFSLGTAALRELGKREPHAKEVYLRAAQYEQRYVARARWDVGQKSRRGKR